MSDVEMVATSVLLIAAFAAGWIAGRIGMIDPLRPARREEFPLPLALRLVDKQRASHRRGWTRLRLARWLWRWGRR